MLTKAREAKKKQVLKSVMKRAKQYRNKGKTPAQALKLAWNDEKKVRG